MQTLPFSSTQYWQISLVSNISADEKTLKNENTVFDLVYILTLD